MKVRHDILDHRIFNSRIRSAEVTKKETWLGYFLGPFSVMLMNSILSSYLNVYYTDVCDLSHLMGGWFLTLFPVVVKILDALTFVIMGRILDRYYSRQGKARPWILFSAPLLVVSMALLFLIPGKNDLLLMLWIFLSYNLFYSVAFTAYNTAHTLMVPLSTSNDSERSRLSVIANCQGMLTGSIVAVLFPTFIVPAMGVDQHAWMAVMTCIALACFPFILLEFFYTRERVTESARGGAENGSAAVYAEKKMTMKEQGSCCLKSTTWKAFMVYIALLHLTNALCSSSTFYYCNWVLGTYNDGRTQMLYYVLGNGPLGLGPFICRPICRKFGRKNAMCIGFFISAAGCLLGALNPTSLTMVLAGQILKSIGLIPSTYMTSTLLGNALDDVEEVSGARCDGFSSSIFNVINVLAVGLATAALNLGLSQFGYLAPTAAEIPEQSQLIRNFFIICNLGLPVLIYPAAGILSRFIRETGTGYKSGKRKR